MFSYEEVFSMLEGDVPEGKRCYLKAWVETYNRYSEAKVKLATLRRADEFNKKRGLRYNQYYAEVQAAQVKVHERDLEITEENILSHTRA
jgi:hypothetical protein